MPNHLLQSAVWPSIAVGAPERMYFRATPNDVWRTQLEGGVRCVPQAVARKARLRLNTFFGAFSLTSWCNTGNIDSVIVCARLQGRCRLRVWRNNGHEPRALLWEGDVHHADPQAISVPVGNLRGQTGVLYPEFDWCEEGFCLTELHYLTSQEPLAKPRLAIIMPTFRRESYVRKNIAALSQAFISQPASPVALYVIDNAGTLHDTPPPGVHVLPNRNFGGSGGFARGVLEVMQSHSFSHCLFCDDDIVMEPESVKRLSAFLCYIDSQVVIGGGMLNMGAKHILHELGALSKIGNVYVEKQHSNERKESSLINYDRASHRNYFGWWFCALPVAAFETFGLPMPYFVRVDDQEFGMRLSQAGWKMETLLGCAVWHDEFHKKDSPAMDYYILRNGLITCWLREHYFSRVSAVNLTLRRVAAALLTYRYERAEFLLLGAQDALKGPGFLRSLEPDTFHAHLMKTQTAVPTSGYAHLYHGHLDQPIRQSQWRRLFMAVTLNGHLLPSFLMRNTHETVAVEPLHGHRFGAIFRRPAVLYYEPTSGRGILCRIDRPRFFSLATQLFRTSLRLLISHRRIRHAWQKSERDLTSVEFWRTYLDLDDGASPSTTTLRAVPRVVGR